MKDLALIGVGIAALLLVGKKSNAATPQGTRPLQTNPIFNRPLLGTGWGVPASSGRLYSSPQPNQNQTWYGLGNAVGGLINSGGAKSIGGWVSDALGLNKPIGWTPTGGIDPLTGAFPTEVSYAGGASPIIDTPFVPDIPDFFGAGDYIAPEFSWSATAGGDEAAAAVDPTGGYIAAAAAIDSEVFDGQVGQTIVDNVDGLGNSLASFFDW